MLVRADLVQAQDLPFGHARQGSTLAFIVLFVVFAVGLRSGDLVDAQKAVEFLDGSVGTEGVITGADVDGGLIENCREHLRGDEALPNELVEFEYVVVEKSSDVFGRPSHLRGAHCFVGFLGVLLGFIKVGLLGKIIFAEARPDQLADLIQRIFRYVHRIGAHVGN